MNESYKTLAYTDNAFPTVSGLTTSAPSVIAAMIFNVGVRQGDRLLEIGTGTGYEAAVLAEMGVKVFTIEVDRRVTEKANRVLVALGYKTCEQMADRQKRKQCLKRFNKIREQFPFREKVRLFWGNGQNGCKEYAPFNAVIVAASIPHLVQIKNLVKQLSPHGGRLIVPVGSRYEQRMHLLEKRGDRINGGILKGLSFNFVRMVANQEESQARARDQRLR